jgi:hypothetical protein
MDLFASGGENLKFPLSALPKGLPENYGSL